MWTTLGASRACETSQKLIKILRSARLRPQVGYIPARTKTETETETATKTFSLLSTPALVLPMQKRNSKRKLHFNCFRAEPLDLYAVTLLLINKICERALAQLSVTTTTMLCAEQQSQRQSLMECIVGGLGAGSGSLVRGLELCRSAGVCCCEMAAKDQVASCEQRVQRHQGKGLGTNKNKMLKQKQ